MKKKKVILIVVAVLILAAAAVALFFLRGGKGNEKPPEEEPLPEIPAPVVYELEENAVIAVPVGKGIIVREEKPKPPEEPKEEKEESEDKSEEKTDQKNKKDKGGDQSQEESKDKDKSKDKQKNGTKPSGSAPAGDSSAQPQEKPSKVVVSVIYHYEGLPKPVERLQGYCALLMAPDFGFVPVDADVIETVLPSFEEGIGHVNLVRPMPDREEDNEALFSVQIDWTGELFSVTVGQIEGGIVVPPQPDPMTLFEAMDFFYQQDPARLGLPGESMQDYRVYAMDGLAMVGQTPCMRLNVYSTNPETGTTEIAGQYLMNSTGSQVYRVGAGELEELGKLTGGKK